MEFQCLGVIEWVNDVQGKGWVLGPGFRDKHFKRKISPNTELNITNGNTRIHPAPTIRYIDCTTTPGMPWYLIIKPVGLNTEVVLGYELWAKLPVEETESEDTGQNNDAGVSGRDSSLNLDCNVGDFD